MRRPVGLLALLLPAIASAQPGAVDPGPPVEAGPPLAPPSAAPQWPQTDPQVLSLARGTRLAAERGDCVGARVLGSQLARLDPGFHATVIKTDPVIANCRPAARKYSVVVEDEEKNAYLPARTGTPPISGGTLAGQFILGGLFTLGGGFVGAYLGFAMNQDCGDEDCFGGAILGAFVGGTLSAAVAVNLVGDSDEVEGSFGLALGGSVIGGLVGIGMVANSDGGEGAVFMMLAAPTIGAMLGHGLSRSYKPQRAPSGPSYDRRLAIQPAPGIADGVGFTVSSGTF